MAIVRWDPFDSFLNAQQDLNRVFRRGWLGPATESEVSRGGTWTPAIDVYETDDSMVVEAELPGLDPKDIDVSIEDGLLHLKGERKLEKEVTEENYYRVERAYGMFERSLQLPADVDPRGVKASYDNGVLKVTVPKVEPKKPRSIPIEVEKKKEKK